MKKYVLIEIDVKGPEYDDDEICSENVVVSTKQFEISEILQDGEFRQELIKNGWADTSRMDFLKDTANLGPRLFCLGWYSQYSNNVSGIIYDEMTNNITGNNTIFAVEVNLEAIKGFDLPLYEKMKTSLVKQQRAQKASIASAEKRKVESDKRQQRKEAKKLENARKLLEKAGLKVE